MNESQRQEYLRAMGIQPYFPRIPVAGAKLSPQYQIEAAVDSVAVVDELVDEPASVPAVATVVTSTATVDSRRPLPKNETPDSAATPDSPDPAETPDTHNTLRFSLNYYRVTDTLAVIDEVPFQQAQKTPADVHELLHKILKALDVDSEQVELLAETFNWPLEAGIVMKGDPAQAARRSLFGYIGGRHQADKFRNLIVFAGQIAELMLTPEEQQANAVQVETARELLAGNGAYRITVTHSLRSLLANEVLKRDTWAHLQPLRQRLSNSKSSKQ